MVSTSPTISSFSSSLFSTKRGVCSGHVWGGVSRGDEFSSPPGPYLLGPEEKHQQEKRLVILDLLTRQIHSMSDIPDDNSQRRAPGTPVRSFLHFDWSEGCVLACSYSSLCQEFLGFCVGDKHYHFRAMPFELNIVPRVFTKLCCPVLQELSTKGMETPRRSAWNRPRF